LADPEGTSELPWGRLRPVPDEAWPVGWADLPADEAMDRHDVARPAPLEVPQPDQGPTDGPTGYGGSAQPGYRRHDDPPVTADRLVLSPGAHPGDDLFSAPQLTSPGLAGTAEGKIALWGSPASGKTTYLAALRHAVGPGNTGLGHWNIFPANEVSLNLLVRFTQALVNKHEFPPPTLTGATVPLQWNFVGDLAKTKFDHRLIRRGPVLSRFLLDLIDVSGGAFADEADGQVPAHVVKDAIDHLTSAKGLIYLFDPISERVNMNAVSYVNRTVAELLTRFNGNGWTEPYLPHHVAVCITKFDHPTVFQQARELGLVNQGGDGLPRVHDEHAKQFFDKLCDGAFWQKEHDERGNSSAHAVRHILSTAFDPKKVKYYVTSSIGFWRPPGWDPSSGTRFDPENFANYVEANGRPGIRGSINPINVLEPLISLSRRIEKG
jgi:hypothetical protein